MIPFFGASLHPHAVMEVIAYSGGFQAYRVAHRREKRLSGDLTKIATATQLWVIAGAIVGAALGAKLLALAESFDVYWPLRHEPERWLGAKTIVGGVLGGWGGAEVAKRWLGVKESTGDAYVAGLVFGIAVGRLGYFLTGLDDHTYGTPTSGGVPWGVDFGDGVTRHPTQLYESTAVVALGLCLWIRAQWQSVRGELFRLFLAGYLIFRFGVEFIKPVSRPIVGLSVIQVASVVGAVLALRGVMKGRRVRSQVVSKSACDSAR